MDKHTPIPDLADLDHYDKRREGSAAHSSEVLALIARERHEKLALIEEQDQIDEWRDHLQGGDYNGH